MMAKLRVLFVIIPLFAQALSQNIDVQLIKGLPSNLKPGSKNTVVIKILNNTNESISVNANLTAPDNWRSFYNKSLQVNDNSANILPISILTPNTSNPGSYKLVLNLSNSDINYYKKLEINTLVLKNIDFEVKLINAPKISIAGKDVQAYFSIYNKSNSQISVHLSSTRGTIIGSKIISLDIGETNIINVFSETDKYLTRNMKKTIDLSVSSGPLKITETANINVLSSGKYKSDRFHRLPTKISAMYLYRSFGNSEYTGFQGNLYSSGNLGPSNKHYLEIKARGPDQFNNSILGLYDEYSINYTTKNIHLYIGDDSYSLTRLTEYGRYGSGVLAKYADDKYELGFFYMKPRFFPKYKEELASFFSNRFDDKNSYGLTFLQKTPINADKPINLYSARYTTNPLKYLQMDVEYSFGKMNDNTGHGYSIELSNQTDKFHSSIQLIDANKDFPGYYNNTRFLNGNLQYTMNKNFRIYANFHEDESNAQRDTLFGVSPYTKNISGGLSFTYRFQDYINVFLGQRERKDRMPLQKFHYNEFFARISLLNNLYNFHSTINNEFAETKNLITNTGGQSYKGSISLRYKLNRMMSFSSFLQYYNTYRYSSDRSQEIVLGGEASINYKSNTQLSLSYQNAHNIEEYYRDRSLFEFRATKVFMKKNELEFLWAKAIKQKTVGKSDTYIGLKYTFNFGIPLKKIKNLGSLRGQVINKGVGNIKNILLNLDGRMQITNEDGLFLFSNMPSGEYYLYIDNSSLEFNDITNVKMPLLVTIDPDQLTDIQIELTKAGSISGTVNLDIQDEHSEKFIKDDSENQKNVIIEIAMDKEVHRDIIYLNNNFIFTGLRPGEWKLKVYHNSLGNNFIIKNSEMVINLAPGETEVANIDIIKKARRILFQPSQIIVN